MNRRKNKKGSSRFKGVSREMRRGKIRWSAKIKVRGKSFTLSVCVEEEDAAVFYNVAAQLFFGEFARPNPGV